MPALQSITGSNLISTVEQARGRVVLVAPGVAKHFSGLPFVVEHATAKERNLKPDPAPFKS
ncbi:MAG: hypothetical protein KF712_03160 [Akkermansiaceae bacterium]|nr:hypothetical protein [Akkermansiaceae bacterium]